MRALSGNLPLCPSFEEALAMAASHSVLWRPSLLTPQHPEGTALLPARGVLGVAATPSTAGGVERVKVVLSLERGLDGVGPFTGTPIPFAFHPTIPLDRNVANMVFVLKNQGYKQFDCVSVSGRMNC
jgi:hypothetical protein